MSHIIIAKMGIEGGGCTIYGQQVDGVWSFWQGRTSMALDENDDEVWRQWQSEHVANLQTIRIDLCFSTQTNTDSI